MNDIKYKILFAFAIPYLTLCAGLWNIGYWSTFDINIIQHLDTAALIKSFIYPFIVSVAFYFGGQIASVFLFHNSLLWQKEFKYGPGSIEETAHPKRFKILRYFIVIFSILMIILAFFFIGNEKWVFIFFMIATFAGIYLNNRNFLNTIIPERNFRLNFVFTIVLIPFMSFGFAKKKSLDIYDNSSKKTTFISITTSQSPPTFSQNDKYKLLGIASDFIFLMTMDNKSIIMLPKTDVKQITIDR